MNFCNKENYQKIEEYISKYKEEILNDLMDLVRIPSLQGDPLENAPYGIECDNLLKATAELYKKKGVNSVIKNDKGYALSYFGEEKDKTIGLFSHGDVVPADGEWLICPPFQPKEFQGHIFGRGVNDDKSGIIQAIYAVKIIEELKLPLKSNILIYTGVNEETGMGDINAYVENEKMPDVSLVLDGEYPCYLSESGSLRFDLTAKTPFKDVKKIKGGKALNVILGKVNAEIKYNSELYSQIKKLCSGNESFKVDADNETIYVTAFGKENHTIHIDDSVNALMVLADMLCKCEALCETDRKILLNVYNLIKCGHGEGFKINSTCDSVFCGNGIVDITEQGSIKAFFDIRCSYNADLQKMVEIIKNSISDDWNYNFIRVSPGYTKTEDDVFVQLLSDTYSAVSGEKDVKCVRTSGGTYSRVLKNAYSIGTVGYYKAKPIDLPKGHGGVHQPDEKLNIDGFLEALKLLVCFIMEFDEKINN